MQKHYHACFGRNPVESRRVFLWKWLPVLHFIDLLISRKRTAFKNAKSIFPAVSNGKKSLFVRHQVVFALQKVDDLPGFFLFNAF
jgi:hypothetical protein